MYLRLCFSFLKNTRLAYNRTFRNSMCIYKDVKEMQKTNDVNKDEPIKYSTSEAAKWKTIYSTSGKDYYETPRIQPIVVFLSLTVFMVYFCILREENDLDDWIRELESTMPLQIEEATLRAQIENGKKRGIDVRHLETRMEKIKSLRETAIKNL